jgi:hypothetical protein
MLALTLSASRADTLGTELVTPSHRRCPARESRGFFAPMRFTSMGRKRFSRRRIGSAVSPCYGRECDGYKTRKGKKSAVPVTVTSSRPPANNGHSTRNRPQEIHHG